MYIMINQTSRKEATAVTEQRYVIRYNAGGFSDGFTKAEVDAELAIPKEHHPYGGVAEFWPCATDCCYQGDPRCTHSITHNQSDKTYRKEF